MAATRNEPVEDTLDFDAVLLEEMRGPGTKCTMCHALATGLSPEQSAKVQRALDDPKKPGTAIARALARIGVKVSGETVRRHRAAECAGRRPL